MLESTAHCSTMWSNVRKLGHIVQQCEHCSRNHSTLLGNYSQQLGLNNNHFPVESAFNFYVNNKITDCLEGTVNIESTRENFYTELFQHTSLPRNYNKGKERLQTPAVTPKQIQPPNWKKTQVELLTNPSYYYTPKSAINISSTDTFTSNVTSIFGHFLFQSKQKKAELLGLYESERKQKEEEKKEFKNQEFTYQNPIPENPDIRTLNFQTQQNLNLGNLEIETLNFQMQHDQNN
ncbi:hypothetical protein G9A89_013731 [Geosiphon pyriformis]|nr:hypothetical protein G9A89_013731 [Geosiphon pyriformis]